MSYKKGSMNDLFLELAGPSKDGFSRVVSIEEFIGKYARLTFGNGGHWSRDDGTLAKKYIIKRHKSKGKITGVELCGFSKVFPVDKGVPAKIKKEITSRQCVATGVSNPECDHKDGRYDDKRLQDKSSLTVDDFQPLSKSVNAAKREHCKKCKETGKRFDARTFGYAVGFFLGDEYYNNTCVGCYWHDIRRFNYEVSEWWDSVDGKERMLSKKERL